MSSINQTGIIGGASELLLWGSGKQSVPVQPPKLKTGDTPTLAGAPDGAGHLRFRFCAKEAKTYRYRLAGNVPALEGCTGEITTFLPSMDAALLPDPSLPNWWTDDPSPALAEGPNQGVKTVSQWRPQFLHDFAARLERCRIPRNDAAKQNTLGGGPQN